MEFSVISNVVSFSEKVFRDGTKMWELIFKTKDSQLHTVYLRDDNVYAPQFTDLPCGAEVLLTLRFVKSDKLYKMKFVCVEI